MYHIKLIKTSTLIALIRYVTDIFLLFILCFFYNLVGIVLVESNI